MVPQRQSPWEGASALPFYDKTGIGNRIAADGIEVSIADLRALGPICSYNGGNGPPDSIRYTVGRECEGQRIEGLRGRRREDEIAVK